MIQAWRTYRDRKRRLRRERAFAEAARREQRFADEQLVLDALAEVPESAVIPLTKQTGLDGGRVHVALARLERTGQVTSEWVTVTHPRRRMYRLARQEG